MSNDLDELESDRHSLLDDHDLDNSDHSLLDDDVHNLLEANSELMLMQRHKEILSGLVDTNHLMQIKSNSLVNGFGLLDREPASLTNSDRQINQSILDKEALLRERSRNEMIMRQNELLARQHDAMVDPKHYLPTSSIALESPSELLGKTFFDRVNSTDLFVCDLGLLIKTLILQVLIFITIKLCFRRSVCASTTR